MKIFFALISLVSATNAFANLHGYNQNTIFLNPGDCITVGANRICAHVNNSSDFYNQSVHQIRVFCNLEEHGSGPKKWIMYQVTTSNTGKTRKTLLKTFAHFEGKECESEARRFNQE